MASYPVEKVPASVEAENARHRDEINERKAEFMRLVLETLQNLEIPNLKHVVSEEIQEECRILPIIILGDKIKNNLDYKFEGVENMGCNIIDVLCEYTHIQESDKIPAEPLTLDLIVDIVMTVTYHNHDKMRHRVHNSDSVEAAIRNDQGIPWIASEVILSATQVDYDTMVGKME